MCPTFLDEKKQRNVEKTRVLLIKPRVFTKKTRQNSEFLDF
jgi:hypothetical protein